MSLNRRPDLGNILSDLKRRIRTLETRTLRVPSYSADPASPQQGEIWVNSTSGDLRIHVNGVTRTV